MSEFPPPIRLPGEPAAPDEPYESTPGHEPPAVVDDVDQYGAEAAAAALTERIEQVPTGVVRVGADGRPLLSPPFDPDRDHVDGPVPARATVVVFGAYATPASRPLATVLSHLRERHPSSVGVAWRHYPDPVAHPRAVMLALAAEAAAARGRFWALTRELLHMRHHDPSDLHAAMLRVGLDPERALEAMRAGTGADRITDDVVSARASSVTFSPVLFVNGERYAGELDSAAVDAALET
jgi:protein-disulfide isomerase